MTRQTVDAIEASQYSPSLQAAIKVARVLAVPLEEVFCYPASTPGTPRSR